MTRSGKSECGATIAEAALVLILLFTFLMGIIEFGRCYNIYQNVTNAAREGARYAVAPCSAMSGASCPGSFVVPAGWSIGTPSESDIQAKVQTYLASNGVNNATTYVCSYANQNDCGVSIGGKEIFSAVAPACRTPSRYCTRVNGLDTNFTAVAVRAPYQFLFFRNFGTINIHSEARMRDEVNN
ncbi:MAG: TadE/TadG family type IV pilus assembly protein [Terriglobales bacterium]